MSEDGDRGGNGGVVTCATGKRIHTNQMSVGEYYSPIPKGRGQMPAVFFIYDLSPITVTVRLLTLAQKQQLVYLQCV